MRFDIKLSLGLSGISPKGFGLLGHNWLVGHNFVGQNGDEGVRLRAPVDKGQTRVCPGLDWIGRLNNLWITSCYFLELPLLSPSIHRKWAPKGSSFTLDHSLWITLWTSHFWFIWF